MRVAKPGIANAAKRQVLMTKLQDRRVDA
jgi:hypothetical protein